MGVKLKGNAAAMQVVTGVMIEAHLLHAGWLASI